MTLFRRAEYSDLSDKRKTLLSITEKLNFCSLIDVQFTVVVHEGNLLFQDQYYAELSAESGIDRVPPVMFKIRAEDTKAKLASLYTYRNYVYTVKDDETFTRALEVPLFKNNRLSPQTLWQSQIHNEITRWYLYYLCKLYLYTL